MADVGKADVVGQVGVEHVVADAATYAQTTVQTAEVVAVERAFSLALGKVLYLSAYAHSKVSAHEGLQREVVVHLVLVFYNRRNLQIVQVVGHLLAVGQILLTTLFYIRQSRLKIQGRCVGERNACHYAHVEARLPVAAVETFVVRVDIRERRTDAQTVVGHAVAVMIVAVVESSGLFVVVSAVAIVLCRSRHKSQD